MRYGRALEAEAVNVGLIDCMLTRGLEDQPTTPAPTVATASRFVRDSGDFSVRRPSSAPPAAPPQPEPNPGRSRSPRSSRRCCGA
jgi:hypothetical protein